MAMTMAQASAAMREAMRETVKRYSTWYLLEGVLLVVAGVLALIYPYVASVTLVFLLGWILIISGVLQGIGLIGAKDVPHFWLQLVSAVLAILIGMLLLRNPNAGLLIMTVLLIVYFFVEGISKVIFALNIRPFVGLAVGAAQRHRRHSARRLSVGQHAGGVGMGAWRAARHPADRRGRGARLSRLDGALELTETMSRSLTRETPASPLLGVRRRSSGQRLAYWLGVAST